jgi:hypothetical protein
MPPWAKAALRIVGVLNAALAVRGVYWLGLSVYGFLLRYPTDSEYPYFGIAFVVMTVLNITFLAFFLVIAFQLLKLKPSAVALHSIASVSLVVYGLLNGGLWLAGRGIGASIGAATGVGNMGIAPLVLLFVVPYLYPISSTIVLQVTRMKMKAT